MLLPLRALHHYTPKPLLKTTQSNPFPPFLHSSLHTQRSLPPHKPPKSNWNTNHTFVLTNPILSILENKCKSINHLKQIQSQMTTNGLILDSLASSRLIAFCALSETPNLHYCKKLLFCLPNPNVFSWNIAIRAYAESENPLGSFFLYKQMLLKSGVVDNSVNLSSSDLKVVNSSGFSALGIAENSCTMLPFKNVFIKISSLRPDNYTFPLLFKTCARLSLYYVGFEILVHVLKMGHDQDIFVHNALIHFLVTCGELEAANKVFGESCVRDLVSWNSLINGYVRSGRPGDALRIYKEMETEGVEADEVTMIGVVSSCAQLEELVLGRRFHKWIVDKGLKLSVPLGNALMDMYVKCGDLGEARALFDRMKEKTMVSWTTMVAGYAKCGCLDVARRLFDEMPEKDVVPWNALISGFVQANCGKEALALFHEMQASNIKPDEVTMVSCLSACSQLGALDVGIWIHNYIEKHQLTVNVALGTALIDMYAKCGNMKKSLQVFNEISGRNSLTWTAVICGLALHGDAKNALSHFWEMIDVGLMPDEITFLGVLSACCHGGLVQEGRHIFAQMDLRFQIPPKLKHYSCMVDLLGRAGLVEEAEELIKSMPMKADAVVWGALFFACRMHKNVEVGERAAFKLLELDPCDSGIYVLLASMYVEANMWQKAGEVRRMMRERGVDKTPGCSSIEVDGNVSEFIIRDRSHPESDQIYRCLIQLSGQMELIEQFGF